MSSKEIEPISEFEEVSEIDAKKQINDWAGKSDVNDRNGGTSISCSLSNSVLLILSSVKF